MRFSVSLILAAALHGAFAADAPQKLADGINEGTGGTPEGTIAAATVGATVGATVAAGKAVQGQYRKNAEVLNTESKYNSDKIDKLAEQHGGSSLVKAGQDQMAAAQDAASATRANNAKKNPVNSLFTGPYQEQQTAKVLYDQSAQALRLAKSGANNRVQSTVTRPPPTAQGGSSSSSGNNCNRKRDLGKLGRRNTVCYLNSKPGQGVPASPPATTQRTYAQVLKSPPSQTKKTTKVLKNQQTEVQTRVRR
ncbi:hypothetical protein PpBr36_07778 [Pyricularia pennisetigena]|uniref:hypothetical protein n=1 Tax=Pyricularia pennisetigena TaxID=1578925 RepID=UPI0011503076|nr:hypothetical protein PpBr36_07778 [Pyricularia pennisetigena]TLS25405.1 hypothetical protein PpBr36_07778 [Pyricularia pennisetigena]